MTDFAKNPGLMVREFGRARDVIRLEDCPRVELAPGQVRVSMTLAAINPSDLITISGAYRSRTQLPFIGGFEGVGTVCEVAADVTMLVPGMRVLPIGSMGAWQAQKVADATWCFPVDDTLSDEQAATSYINPMTAWLMLHDAAKLTPDTRMAVSAAGSVIGRMILRLANKAGLRPIAIIRREAGSAALEGFDLEDLIVADDRTDCTGRLKSGWGGRGPNLALDAVGGATGQSMIDALTSGGHMLHYGLLSGRPLGQGRPLRDDIRFELYALRNWIHGQPKTAIAAARAATGKLVADGTLASPIEAIHPLDDFRNAFDNMEQSGRDGKILLNPNPAV